MSTIHLLPDYLIAQIAAGEVIERPAYAVKELIDNSIDAKSTRIFIDLLNSGQDKIVVTDNGIGMTKEDLVESYKLHTTSKVHTNNSLSSIKTLGFRGEALASIAAVSGMILESRPPEEVAGTKVILKNGLIERIVSLGMPTGTRIIVEQLFHSLPARKKFLKSKRTELKHCLEIINAHAIASPSIGFHVSHNGKLLFDLPQSQPLSERIHSLFGLEISSHIIPIQFEDAYIKISGFVVTPRQSSYVMSKQYLSVNTRPVYDKSIQQAVKDAYGTMLARDVQPSWFISITLPPEFVDVNIHPRKEIVLLANQQFIRDALVKTVTENITTARITPQLYVRDKITTTYLGNDLKRTVLPWNKELLTKLSQDIVFQIHNVYILTTTLDGFLLIDQHAAHERILYDQFTQQFLKEKERKISVPLSYPIVFSLSHSESLLLEEYLEDLEKIGFTIENFSNDTYTIKNIPLIFKDRNVKKLIIQLLSDFNKEIFTSSVDSQSKKLLAYLACRSAVKSGDPLTQQQMIDIIKELDKNPEAITCPHGRPLKVYVSLTELHKMFKRK